MEINLVDANGNELAMNDVIIVHYPNEKIKHIGILHFDKERWQFFLGNHAIEKHYLPEAHGKLEKLASSSGIALFKDSYGRHQFARVVEAKRFMRKLEERLFKEVIKA